MSNALVTPTRHQRGGGACDDPAVASAAQWRSPFSPWLYEAGGANKFLCARISGAAAARIVFYHTFRTRPSATGGRATERPRHPNVLNSSSKGRPGPGTRGATRSACPQTFRWAPEPITHIQTNLVILRILRPISHHAPRSRIRH